MMGVIALSGCGEGGSESGNSTTGKTASPASSNPAPTPAQTNPDAAPKPAAPPTQAVAVDSRSQAELVTAGRSVYTSNCIACHNMNPSQDGALGPAVAGSNLELIEARVLRGEYPEGYTPKRPSKIMIPLPHLEPKLPELAAYLGSLSSES